MKFGINFFKSKNFLIVFLIFLIFIIYFSFIPPARAQNATLYLAPSQGTFLIGSTFSLSIYLDTKGKEINALEVDLKFPPDILQVTTPMAGKSFISEWTVPPNYSNTGGTISFKGGIPEGIVTSAGLISTITFRGKSAGAAEIKFLDSSKILLKDGKGTPVFTNNLGGIYEISISPPEGPKILSNTHSDSDKWYSDPNPTFSWEKEAGVTDFSFSFSQNPQENPDTISEGSEIFKSYEGVADGIWYFHLRQKKNEVWGKTSHYLVKIDTTPPQRFEPKVDTSRNFVYFETNDFHSGIDHYEISILNISKNPTAAPFFLETTSPFKIPQKETGKYIIVVRAYDKAGNFQTAETRFQMISPIFSLVEGKGIQLKRLFLPWWLVYGILSLTFIFWVIKMFSSIRKRNLAKRLKKEVAEAEKEIEDVRKLEKRIQEMRTLEEETKKEAERLAEKLKGEEPKL